MEEGRMDECVVCRYIRMYVPKYSAHLFFAGMHKEG